MITIEHPIRRVWFHLQTGWQTGWQTRRRSRQGRCASAVSAPKTTFIQRFIRVFAVALVLLIVSGCTNSKLIIGPLYNRLDDQMRGEFHKLAKWNPDQIAHFESRVGTFHVWHRQEELPKYANLLSRVQKFIRKRGTTTAADINIWLDEAEGFSRNARVCHPVNFSYDLMRTLSDKQVNFIERRFARERKKNFSKYLDATPEERRIERVKNVVKWAGRIGFDFNNTQKRMLNKTFAQQISLRRQYYALVDVWARDLFVIARNQEAPDYEQKMRAQVNELWTLLEKGHAQEWQENRELWREFGIEFVKSLSHDQRIHASNWLAKMGKTINRISKDKPSFKVIADPQYGCLVGQPIPG